MSEPTTAIITRRIIHGRDRDYDAWLLKIIALLHTAPGYDGATMLTTRDGEISVRAIIVRFQTPEHLAAWGVFPPHQALIKEANTFSTPHRDVTDGMEVFFTMPGATAAGPPRWKMCLILLPLVYAMVNLFTLALAPLIGDWPPQLKLLPVIAILIVVLTYVAVPLTTKVFAPWLFETPVKGQ